MFPLDVFRMHIHQEVHRREKLAWKIEKKKRKKEECPKVAQPHMFIADTADQADRAEQLIVVGYADNQEQLARARRGRKTTTISGGVVVPRDLKVGNKVRVKGHFTLMSSGGFNTSNGLVEYASHETLAKASK